VQAEEVERQGTGQAERVVKAVQGVVGEEAGCMSVTYEPLLTTDALRGRRIFSGAWRLMEKGSLWLARRG